MRVTSLDSCDCFISEQVIPKVREPHDGPRVTAGHVIYLSIGHVVSLYRCCQHLGPVLRQRRPRRSQSNSNYVSLMRGGLGESDRARRSSPPSSGCSGWHGRHLLRDLNQPRARGCDGYGCHHTLLSPSEGFARLSGWAAYRSIPPKQRRGWNCSMETCYANSRVL